VSMIRHFNRRVVEGPTSVWDVGGGFTSLTQMKSLFAIGVSEFNDSLINFVTGI
jgi:hypothetical protein